MPREGKPEQLQHFYAVMTVCVFLFFSSPFFPFLSNLLAGLACLRCGCRDEGLCTLHAQRQVEHMGSLEVDIISQWMSVDCRQSEAGTRDGHRECHLLILCCILIILPSESGASAAS